MKCWKPGDTCDVCGVQLAEPHSSGTTAAIIEINTQPGVIKLPRLLCKQCNRARNGWNECRQVHFLMKLARKLNSEYGLMCAGMHKGDSDYNDIFSDGKSTVIVYISTKDDVIRVRGHWSPHSPRHASISEIYGIACDVLSDMPPT